jgi:hypothetical protein
MPASIAPAMAFGEAQVSARQITWTCATAILTMKFAPQSKVARGSAFDNKDHAAVV